MEKRKKVAQKSVALDVLSSADTFGRSANGKRSIDG